MTDKQKVVLMRFARTLGAVLVASLAAYLVGPDAADVVPKEWLPFVVAVVAPTLTAAEKALRTPSDLGGGDSEG